MFGYPPETADERVQPFAADRFSDPLARRAFIDRLARDGSVTDYQMRLRRTDGSAIWVEVTARATAIDAAGLPHIEALVRDVSERKKLEDQARDLYHQLLQAEKMA